MKLIFFAITNLIRFALDCQIKSNHLHSYAAISVTGNTEVGGVIGYQESGGSASNSFFDAQATGQTNGVGNNAGATGVYCLIPK